MSFSDRSNDLTRREVEGWRCADWTEKVDRIGRTVRTWHPGAGEYFPDVDNHPVGKRTFFLVPFSCGEGARTGGFIEKVLEFPGNLNWSMC